MTIITRLAVYAADQGVGLISEANEDFLGESHEFFANFTVFRVIIHILDVFLKSFVHGENLVKSMWNGYKQRPDDHSCVY